MFLKFECLPWNYFMEGFLFILPWFARFVPFYDFVHCTRLRLILEETATKQLRHGASPFDLAWCTWNQHCFPNRTQPFVLKCPFTSLWFPYYVPIISVLFPNNFPIISSICPYYYPMISLFPDVFPIVSLLFANLFSVTSLLFPYYFPMSSNLFSYIALNVSQLFQYYFIIISV